MDARLYLVCVFYLFYFIPDFERWRPSKVICQFTEAAAPEFREDKTSFLMFSFSSVALCVCVRVCVFLQVILLSDVAPSTTSRALIIIGTLTH